MVDDAQVEDAGDEDGVAVSGGDVVAFLLALTPPSSQVFFLWWILPLALVVYWMNLV